jgi:protoporphyrinogen oxidase
MKKIAIIGAGISGLTTARLLTEKGYQITIFEKESQPGGLIRCKRIDGNLYHICGGHIFNSKREDVLNWFWQIFDKEKEFIKADRNSVVFIGNNQEIPYPIENHMYLFDADIQKSFINDLIQIIQSNNSEPSNFEEFLQRRFGATLYALYFKPYNEKIWRRDLKKVPLTWLEGKLPMPTVQEMIYNNINHIKEKSFVHSTFWYEKENGSQYIANKLASNLNIHYNTNIEEITYLNNSWKIHNEYFDKVIFCGNIKELPKILKGISLGLQTKEINKLESHGTTSVFCYINSNPYSWIYLPDTSHESHRIICTGNFAASNNAPGKMTATIEFTDYISQDKIYENLKKIPLNPQYISHHYNKYTYPIQDIHTRKIIQDIKNDLSKYNFFFTGRFANWEYYNMDIAIGAAMDLCKNIND